MHGLKKCRSVGRRTPEGTLRRKLAGEAGATAVEYGLLVAPIAAAIIGVVGILGGQLIPGFQSVIDGM
jgi:pilus assembly protein Flp/PilA